LFRFSSSSFTHEAGNELKQKKKSKSNNAKFEKGITKKERQKKRRWKKKSWGGKMEEVRT